MDYVWRVFLVEQIDDDKIDAGTKNSKCFRLAATFYMKKKIQYYLCTHGSRS